MAIQQGLTLAFKQKMLQGQVDLLADTLYIALYTSAASLDRTTSEYTAVGEVVGAGYVAGGTVLTGATIMTDAGSNTVFVDFASPSWASAPFTARGALIYNSSQSNATVAVLDFGADKTANSSTFTVTMPANTAATALIRFP